MERLTKRYIDEDDGRRSIGAYTGCTVPEIWFEGEREYRVLDKLADYEDLEEQGLLVRLPCKVGDTVWDIDTGYPEPYKITAFSYGCHDLVGFGCDDDITFYYTSFRRQTAGAFLLSEIGKTVFLTREEAEKKLEEMKNGKK